MIFGRKKRNDADQDDESAVDEETLDELEDDAEAHDDAAAEGEEDEAGQTGEDGGDGSPAAHDAPPVLCEVAGAGASGEVALAITVVGFAGSLAASEVAAVGERLRDAGLVVTRRSRGRVP